MKHCLIALSSLLVAASSFGQATFILNNRVGTAIDAPVFVGSVGGAEKVNQDYLVALYGGAAGAAESALTQQGAALPFRTANPGNGYILIAGQDTTRAVAGTTDAGTAAVQLRAWKASAGATYEAALGSGMVGKSAILTIAGGGGTTPPQNLVGLTSFAVGVPEPTTVALGLLGAGLLAIRRKK